MNKITQFGIVLLFVSFILLGCQQRGTKLDLKEVNIYKSAEFKKEGSDLIVSASEIDNKEIFEAVESIINDASKQEGIVDTTEPNYYLEIIYKNNSSQELYLWLLDAENGKGSFMEVEDTHIIYNFPEELNTQLIDLIDSVKK